MESSERSPLIPAGQSRYAVPVTIESLSKGFVAHKFLIARHYIPRMRMFHRAIYTIEYPASKREIKRKLPSEIIYVIAQYVKAEAIDQGCRDCEQQLGVGPNRSWYVELEEGLRRLERWGGSLKGITTWPAEDTLSKFMLDRYSLSIMPGMWDAQRRGRTLTYLFLCYSPPELPHPLTIQTWNPASYPHPKLYDAMGENIDSIPCTGIYTWQGYWDRQPPFTRTDVLERTFVEQTLASDKFIGRAVREMKLDIVFLAQMCQ